MKNRIYILFLFLVITHVSLAQITFRGCTSNAMGAQDFTLSNTSTITDGGIVRNTFEATPNDFAQGCPAGVCELRIIWSITNTRWEIQLDNDGPAGTPDYTTATLYFNNAASFPNPPDLTLGTWVDALGGTCPIGEFTTFSGDVQSTLPVAFTYFSGAVSGSEVSLVWETAVEINNDYFEIERKVSEGKFNRIGTLAGAGNSTETQSYHFKDKLPIYGVSYYRLKQIDFDGQFEYSGTIEVSNLRGEKVLGEFYPNPSVLGWTNVDFFSERNQPMFYEVFDLAGKSLLTGKKHLKVGDNQLSLDFSTISQRFVLVKITAGQSSSYRKLVLK